MVLTVFVAAKVMTPISAARLTVTHQGKSCQQGFTLLELLVVLSIIVIASAVVLPSISSMETSQLVAQVRQTANAFNYARRIAIVEGAPQLAILFQMDPDDPDFPDRRGEVLQRATIPLLEQYDAVISFQSDINEDPDVLEIIQLEFFPEGGSTGGILHFTLDDLTASIRVDPLTGKIAVRYPGEEFDDDAL